MANEMSFYDVRKRESFTTSDWKLTKDKRGRNRAVTRVRGYPVYRYV